MWDEKKTTKQNFEAMGLVADLNSHVEIFDKSKEAVPVEFVGALSLFAPCVPPCSISAVNMGISR